MSRFQQPSHGFLALKPKWHLTFTEIFPKHFLVTIARLAETKYNPFFATILDFLNRPFWKWLYNFVPGTSHPVSGCNQNQIPDETTTQKRGVTNFECKQSPLRDYAPGIPCILIVLAPLYYLLGRRFTYIRATEKNMCRIFCELRLRT